MSKSKPVLQTEANTTTVKRIRLSLERADRLSQLARAQAVSEDQVVEKALDILFNLTDLLGAPSERQGWSSLSEESLHRVWDNDEDARYDEPRDWHNVLAQSSVR